MDKISLMVLGDLLADADVYKVFLDRIQELGISGVEILLEEQKSHYGDAVALKRFSAELLSRKMSVPCVDLYVNYLHPGHFDEACSVVDKMIAAAATLASPLGMVCGSELPEGMEPNQGREIVAQGIDRAVKTGREKKVAIAIESFGISYKLQSTTGMLDDLYGKVKESPCFFVGDLANPCYGGEAPIISLQKFSDKLKHVHVKDVKKTTEGIGFPAAGGYWLDEEDIGLGMADVPSSLKFLKEKGYAGWYSIEHFSLNVNLIGRRASALKQLLNAG